MFLVICHTSGGVMGVRESALKNVDGSIRVFDTREAAEAEASRLNSIRRGGTAKFIYWVVERPDDL